MFAVIDIWWCAKSPPTARPCFDMKCMSIQGQICRKSPRAAFGIWHSLYGFHQRRMAADLRLVPSYRTVPGRRAVVPGRAGPSGRTLVRPAGRPPQSARHTLRLSVYANTLSPTEPAHETSAAMYTSVGRLSGSSATQYPASSLVLGGVEETESQKSFCKSTPNAKILACGEGRLPLEISVDRNSRSPHTVPTSFAILVRPKEIR
jgi:hypothetical protein